MGGACLATAICPPASQPSCPAPRSIFRVLDSAPEKPAGVLGQERLKQGKTYLLTLPLPFDRVAPCLVNLKTNSPSPAQRSISISNSIERLL